MNEPYDSIDVKPNVPEETFQAGGSVAEGVSGRARIDTTFENTVHPIEVTEKSPRRKDFGTDIGSMEDYYV
jgi:hypothetical protein